jgi:hypothetical protein
MIYKECIDKCFDCVKACDRCSEEGGKTSKECRESHDMLTVCAEVCALVGRLTAKGICCGDIYDLCAKICDECAQKCNKIDHAYAKDCADAAKKCAEACRKCSMDCCNEKKERKVC